MAKQDLNPMDERVLETIRNAVRRHAETAAKRPVESVEDWVYADLEAMGFLNVSGGAR